MIVNAISIDAIDYYLRLNYSSKLGIKTLTAEEVREKSKKYKRACTREFKIKLEVISEENGISRKIKTVKLPSNIQIGHLAAWFRKYGEHDAVEVRYGNRYLPVDLANAWEYAANFSREIKSESCMGDVFDYL